MITFYMVYLGGQYVEREIEAPSKEAAYAELTDEERENYYLLSEAEYDAAFGDVDDDCGSIHFLDVMIGMSENSSFPSLFVQQIKMMLTNSRPYAIL